MNSVPQVETREISDADMDAISGGLTVVGAGSIVGKLTAETPVADLCASVNGMVTVSL